MLGDSDQARKGQLVFAFGSPLGLENSVSMGIVSSVARQLREEDPMIYIQTDASINPGNSGGPLVTATGEVIGINTLILSQSGGADGLSFAAPSNIVRNVYEQIKERGAVQRGAIGVNAQTLNPTIAAGLGIEQPWGVVLSDVHPGGPAEKAGLLSGDVIVELDGKRMQNARQFEVNLYGRRVDSKVELSVLRGGSSRKIDVHVVARPDRNRDFTNMVTPERNLVEEIGILGLDVDAQIAQMLGGLRINSGVVVAARSSDAPFWSMGVLPGDVIHAVNNKPVSTLKDLRSLLAGFKVYDPVVLHIERGGELHYVGFEKEE
jgi:serine protease Do